MWPLRRSLLVQEVRERDTKGLWSNPSGCQHIIVANARVKVHDMHSYELHVPYLVGKVQMLHRRSFVFLKLTGTSCFRIVYTMS